MCWADYDNDGFLDVFVTNGLDSDILPSTSVRLFHNETDGTFVETTAMAGINDTRNGQGCAWSDFDNDGDMDLYIANKGFDDQILTSPQPNALYKNMLVEDEHSDLRRCGRCCRRYRHRRHRFGELELWLCLGRLQR